MQHVAGRLSQLRSEPSRSPARGAPRVTAQNDGLTAGDAVAATVRPAATAAPAYRWADVKTLLDIGFAVVRAVELAVPFA
jgi:hypothetical protein